MSAPSAQSQTWYLLKHDGNSIFGPAPLEQLRTWATEAQVSPLDKVSTDQTHWMRAPMLAELGMDWLVEVTGEHCYGPTTLGAIRDFLLRGEIGPETVLINARTGSSQRVADITELTLPPEEEPGGEPVSRDHVNAPPSADFAGEAATPAEDSSELSAPTVAGADPGRTSIRLSLQQRIRELEAALQEERRLLTALGERYAELEAKYVRLLGHQRPGGPPRSEE